MGSSGLTRRLAGFAGLVSLACIAGSTTPAFADPGTGFTYQGSLRQNGTPVDGMRDMRFRLYDTESGGSPIETIQAFGVEISEGLFSVEVDFGAGPWAANQQLWVEIEAGPADQSQSYEIIGRQKLTATPYALNTRGIVVDASGDVGIGTADPRRPLDVRRNGLAIQESALSGDTSHVLAANDPNIDIIGLNTGSELGGVSLKEVNANGALTDQWSLIRRTGATGSILRFTYGTSPDSWVNPAIMTLTPSGNVGLGTTNPAAPLHVRAGAGGQSEAHALFEANNCSTPCGQEPDTEAIRLTNRNGNGQVGIGFLVGTSNVTDTPDLWLGSGLRGSGQENDFAFRQKGSDGILRTSMYIDGDSRFVGIGTSDPDFELDVNGTLGANEGRFATLRTAGGAAGSFASGRADTVLQVVRDSGKVGLRVENGPGGDAEAAIFSGDVRLGHVDPSSQDTLFVNSIEANPRAGTTDPDFLSIDAGGIFMPTVVGVGSTISNGESQLVVKADDDAFRTSIFKALNAGFSTIFDIRKDGQVFCNGVILCASDERLKHDIRPITSPLDSVLALRGVTFDWNPDQPAATQGEQIGFIAQEVERVLPQLVEEGPDGIKAVNYANLTAVLVEAVKEQQAGIEARDARIEGLEARLDALETSAATENRGLFSASILWPMAVVGGVSGVAFASRERPDRTRRRRR